ncbi:MAG: hypothetical protein JJE22_17435 [Bacteroidia bacterium]|nr:hypothetical protein [Bacteroidia bacterium]
MRFLFLASFIIITLIASAQEEGDTLLNRCPVYITDTVSSNNFFLEFQPSVVKVYRVKGQLTVVVDQRDQFFSLFFNEKKLDDSRYKIVKGAHKKNDVGVKYSFRSGDQVSYVDVIKGTVESSLDKEKNIWHLKVNGLMANLVGRSVTYFKVRADLYIKG